MEIDKVEKYVYIVASARAKSALDKDKADTTPKSCTFLRILFQQMCRF